MKTEGGVSQGGGLRQAFSAVSFLNFTILRNCHSGMTCQGAIRILTHQPHFHPVVPDKRIKGVRQ